MQTVINTRRRGFTLVELVTSLAVASILLVAIGSAMVIASKALPSNDGPAGAMLATASAADKLNGELQYALHFTERTARSLRFTIPDRDGDGQYEVIRFAWSGTAGDPLTRQYNDGAVVNIVDRVQLLNFNYVTQTVVEQYPGPPVEQAEQLLAGYVPSGGSYSSSDKDIDDNNWPGQYFVPTLPANAQSWRVTRVLFMARKAGSGVESMDVQLLAANASKLPTGGVIQQVTLTEPSTSSYQTMTATFSNVAGRTPGSGLCLVIKKDATLLGLGIAGRVEYALSSGGGGLLQAVYDPGILGVGASTTYTHSNSNTLLYLVCGKVVAPSTRSLTRTHVVSVQMALQATADSASRIDTAVTLANRPEVLAAYWESGFDENPITADRDRNGLVDWRSPTGFDVSSLVNGAWQADRTIDTNPAHNFDAFTTVDLAFRDNTTTGNGACMEMRIESNALGYGILESTLARQGDGSQTLTIQTRDLVLLPSVLLTVTGLPAGTVNLRLHVNPADDSVGVTLNGVATGSVTYNRTLSLSDGAVRLYNTSLEAGAIFESIKVRVGGSP